MATLLSNHEAQYLHGIVDMGSNGIRFSISSLQPPTARIMPTLYQHRVDISLYDAQCSASGERQAFDEKTMRAVIRALKRFQQTCADFGVIEENVTVIATEAMRTGVNFEEFSVRIKDEVGWEVNLMSKATEGEIGALGIASSLPEVSGLVMDLGGGSMQLSLVNRDGEGKVKMAKSGTVSMPYGAAAIMKRLTDTERRGTMDDFRNEVKKAIKEAYEGLMIPPELKEAMLGFTLYLSGGGFRGWGYVLMSRHRVQPYPIPVINGFKASRKEFIGTDEVMTAVQAASENVKDEIFRVSDRRLNQVPAVALLVETLAEVFPEFKEVRFCQGGIREGFLFSELDSEVQSEQPLVVATQPFSRCPPWPIVNLLRRIFPAQIWGDMPEHPRRTFTPEVLDAFANLMYYHSNLPKDLQASAALRSTTSGVLAGVHGISHESRTLLALLLCARWGDNVPPVDAPFKQGLEQLVESPWTLWWISYIGAVAALVAAVYPAATSSQLEEGRLKLRARSSENDKDEHQIFLWVELSPGESKELFLKEVKNIEKVGKRKNWIGGKDGIGIKVTVAVNPFDT